MKMILASGSPRRYNLLKLMGWDVEVKSLPFAEAETVCDAEDALNALRKKIVLDAAQQKDPAECKISFAAAISDKYIELSPAIQNSDGHVTGLFSEKDLGLLSPYRNADLVCAYNALGKGKAAANVLGTAVPLIAADTIVVLGENILGKPADAADAKRMLRELSGRDHEVKTGIAVLYQDRTVLKVVTTKVFFRMLTEKEIDWYVQTGEPLDKAGAYGIQGKGAMLVEKIEGSYDNVVGLPLTAVYEILKDYYFCSL